MYLVEFSKDFLHKAARPIIFLLQLLFHAKMKIYIERDDRTLNRRYSGKVSVLLKKIKINPETVIVVRDSELLTEYDTVSDRDSLQLLSVISGG